MPKPSDETLDQPLPPLIEEALHWLVRLHDGNACDTDWESYEHWCLTSIEHQSAAHTAEHLWQQLGSFAPRPRRRTAPLATALLCVLSSISLLSWQGQEHGWMADYQTQVGEYQRFTLADGSQLELAPQTRVDLDFEAHRRVLRLYNGELHVQVAPDTLRPFVVEAAEGKIQALGTGFDVQREGAQVRLVVTEHAVRVQQGPQQMDVHAGQSLHYDEQGLSNPIPVDINNATAWRRGRLVFDGQPLGAVLDALSRYHSGVLWIRDKELRQLPVTGLFDTHNPEAQLELLERSLPIRIHRLPWLTLIEPD